MVSTFGFDRHVDKRIDSAIGFMGQLGSTSTSLVVYFTQIPWKGAASTSCLRSFLIYPQSPGAIDSQF